jgi:DNA-binding response OmpR family regulator
MGELLGRALRRAGFDVLLATDWNEALSAVEGSREPQAIVLDLLLPGEDGLEVCRRFRDAAPHIPILVLSAWNEVDDRIAGLTAGADDFLGKPFSLVELLARVRALLRRRAMSS